MSRPPNPHAGPLPGLSELDSTMAAPVRSLDFDNIGKPVTFTEGPFQDMTIRARLIELQKADLGRKYARKDRRPLDPPPVVQLVLEQLKHGNTPFARFEEYDKYDDAQGFGLLCHIDLFPVPPQTEHPDPASSPNKRRKTPSGSRPATATTPSASTSASPTPTPSVPPSYVSPPSYNHPNPPVSGAAYTLPPPTPPQSMGASGSVQYSYPAPQPPATSSYGYPPAGQPSGAITLPPISSLGGPSTPAYQGSNLQLPPMQVPDHARSGLTLPPLPRSLPSHTYSYPPPPPPGPPTALHPPPQDASGSATIKARPADVKKGDPEGAVAMLGDFAIREDTKCTDALSGACFAQSQSLEYHGRKVLMFVFSDIAVRNEGTFILRYRVFNIFARAEGVMDIPILAECYGGPFRIYSTKEFPGLRPSTDLTKHLSLFGVRLNLRETERKRRRGGNSETPGSSTVRGRRRQRAHRGGGDDDESEEGSSGGEEDE